ncbi:hypothetical protein N9B48_03140, partial [bacterium]|nr:hypothetical protein [bacterium]
PDFSCRNHRFGTRRAIGGDSVTFEAVKRRLKLKLGLVTSRDSAKMCGFTDKEMVDGLRHHIG